MKKSVSLFMAYNPALATRIRDRLKALPRVEEKPMMGGLVFMYKDKMCVGIFKDQLMCRIDPETQDELLKKNGASLMELGCRKMNGYIVVTQDAIRTSDAFEYWIGLCLQFNKKAGPSKKKK